MQALLLINHPTNLPLEGLLTLQMRVLVGCLVLNPLAGLIVQFLEDMVGIDLLTLLVDLVTLEVALHKDLLVVDLLDLLDLLETFLHLLLTIISMFHKDLLDLKVSQELINTLLSLILS